MGSEEKQRLLSNDYCLPTYGLDYPDRGEQTCSSLVQFYRPVEVLVNGAALSNGHSGVKMAGVNVTLTNREQWKKLMSVGNEMIVTTMGR